MYNAFPIIIYKNNPLFKLQLMVETPNLILWTNQSNSIKVSKVVFLVGFLEHPGPSVVWCEHLYSVTWHCSPSPSHILLNTNFQPQPPTDIELHTKFLYPLHIHTHTSDNLIIYIRLFLRKEKNIIVQLIKISFYTCLKNDKLYVITSILNMLFYNFCYVI